MIPLIALTSHQASGLVLPALKKIETQIVSESSGFILV